MGDFEDLFVIEGQRRNVAQAEPRGIPYVGGGSDAMVAQFDQSVIGNRNDTFTGVPFDLAEGVELLQVDLPNAGLLFELAARCLFERFLDVNEATRKGPGMSERLDVPLNQ